MTKCKKTYTIFGVLLLVSTSGYLFFDQANVSVADKNWECRTVKGRLLCTASFTLINKTHNYVECNVSVRAQTKVGGEKTASLRNVGEKIFKLELHPKQVLNLTEEIHVTRMPTVVQINAWE